MAVITSLAYILKQLIDAQLFDGEGNPIGHTKAHEYRDSQVGVWKCLITISAN